MFADDDNGDEISNGMAGEIMAFASAQEDRALAQYLEMIQSGFNPVPEKPDYVLTVACEHMRDQEKRIMRQEPGPYLDTLLKQFAKSKAKIAALVGEEKLEKFLKRTR